MRQAQIDGSVDMAEFRFLLTGGISTGEPPRNPSVWLSDALWGEMCRLSAYPAFQGLSQAFQEDQVCGSRDPFGMSLGLGESACCGDLHRRSSRDLSHRPVGLEHTFYLRCALVSSKFRHRMQYTNDGKMHWHTCRKVPAPCDLLSIICICDRTLCSTSGEALLMSPLCLGARSR